MLHVHCHVRMSCSTMVAVGRAGEVLLPSWWVIGTGADQGGCGGQLVGAGGPGCWLWVRPVAAGLGGWVAGGIVVAVGGHLWLLAGVRGDFAGRWGFRVAVWGGLWLQLAGEEGGRGWTWLC